MANAINTMKKEARKKWRSGLSSKSQPLHGGASGEAPVWRWSGIRRLKPVIAPQLK